MTSQYMIEIFYSRVDKDDPANDDGEGGLLFQNIVVLSDTNRIFTDELTAERIYKMVESHLTTAMEP